MTLLYVHVPFCVKKCDYCAFYSEALKIQKSSPENYLQGLETEVKLRQQDAPQGVSSLFIGGGTPTALSVEELSTLLGLINTNFKFEECAERTVEGNPGTLTLAKLNSLVASGINRFSLGVQSFNDGLLSRIGRIHNSADIRESIRLIREAGLTNLNLDLMFGLPGQSLKDWERTIEEALSYIPEHLSVYGLMLEEGTPLYLKYNVQQSAGLGRHNTPILLPDDDLQAEMYFWAVERLKQRGYIHYETSNFCLPGYECKHNLGYWQGEDYLGLGPAAVSCLNDTRFTNVESISEYLLMLAEGKRPIDMNLYEALTEREMIAERVILGLRLAEGVNLETFKADFGVNLTDIYSDVLERYLSEGVLLIQDGYLRLNKKFIFVANSVLQDFV